MKAWIEAHPFLNGMLTVAVFLGLAVTVIGLALFLLRLLRPSNLRRLLTRPPRDLRSAKLFGQEVEFFETVEAVEQTTQVALENLHQRITNIETVVWTKVLPELEREDDLDLGI